VTGSLDKTIKVWEPMKSSPIAQLEEEEQVDFFVPIISQNDVNIVYVTGSVLKCLSFKHGKSVILLRNDRLITALTQVMQSESPLISFGQENGVIKDFDINSKHVVRRATLHHSKVVSLTSYDKYLISASEDGKIIVYDYMSQQEQSDLVLSKVGLSNPHALLLMKNKKHLVIGDRKGITPVDIEARHLVEITSPIGEISCFNKLPANDDQDLSVFAGGLTDGSIRIWRDR